MTMWVGIYTRVSPFTLASILYHRPSWMSSVCGKLFEERKTGTPIARSPSSNTQEVQLWSSRSSPSLMTFVSYHRSAILSSVFVKVFEKVLERSEEDESCRLLCMCIYTYVCVYVHVHLRIHTGAYTQAPTDTRPLAPFWPVLKRSLKGGGHGGGMMVDWTQNDTPFSTVILTPKFDPKNRPFQVTVWERSEATNEGERSEPKKPSP